MKTCYYELSRRQIRVVWADDTGEQARLYPRTERGEQRANAHLARLQSDGYQYGPAPRDWYAQLLDEVRR